MEPSTRPLWLEQYPVPSDLPNFNVEPDPKELERMKALGLIRMGVGMASREPTANALSAGINTIAKGQADARAEHRANMELLLKQHQAKQQQLQDVMMANWRSNFSPDALKAEGFDQSMIEAAYIGGPKAYLEFKDRLGNRVTKPGDISRGSGGVLNWVNPTPEGNQLQFQPGAKDFTGVTQLPGQAAINYTNKYNENLAIAHTTGETGRNPVTGEMEFSSKAATLGLPQTPLDPNDVLAGQVAAQQGRPEVAPGAPAPTPPVVGARPNPANATALAAQQRLFMLRPELADETKRLAEAVAKGDKEGIRLGEKNIASLQSEISKWSKYANAPVLASTPTAAAPVATAPARPSIRPLDPVHTATQSSVNTTTFTGLNDNFKKLSESAPEGIVQIYRARKALDTAMTGPLSDWKKTGLAFLNETLGFNIKAEEMTKTDVLNKALGTQLLARAKSLGTNPSETDAKRLDTILGTSKDPREGIRDALNYVEVMIRRDVGFHNTRADEYSAQYKSPATLKVTLPTKEELDAQIGAVGGPGVRETRGSIGGAPQSTRGSGAAPPPASNSNATTKAFPNGPPVGTVIDGMTFQGGNPRDEKNWVKKPEKTLGEMPMTYGYTY